MTVVSSLIFTDLLTTTSRRYSSTVRAWFDKYFQKDNVYSWNSIIADFARNGDHTEALRAFYSMRKLDVTPNRSTFPCAIKSCAYLSDILSGMQTHQQAIVFGFESDLFVSSALIDMYSKCGKLHCSESLFDEMDYRNTVTWTAMISGYIQNDSPHLALLTFKEFMAEARDAHVQMVDSVTVGTALMASARVANEKSLASLHGYVVKAAFDLFMGVGNIMLDAYAKCGEVNCAKKVFDELAERDVVSWNTIIAVFTNNSSCGVAFETFRNMISENFVKHNEVTLSTLLVSSANLGALHLGRSIHAQATKICHDDVVILGTSIVDMYCKCGRLRAARNVFDRMRRRNVKTWTSLIAGYGMHGHASEALQVFHKMITTGPDPNFITLVAVLAACSHAGKVEEGRHWFKEMRGRFGIEPGMEHYGCMVDLLGRSGHLKEAYGLIREMREKPDYVIWGSLLASCRIHKEVELAEVAARELFAADAGKCGYYVLISNVYADAGRWCEAAETRRVMEERGIAKPAGYSLVEVKGKAHVFLVGDEDHEERERVYGYLDELMEEVKGVGYVANTGSVLKDVDEEEKGMMLKVHSEKLAVAYGIMNTCRGSTVHVMKNLRVCSDCHCFIKLVTKVVEREVVLRDVKRFHHFKDGVCSCGDYW